MGTEGGSGPRCPAGGAGCTPPPRPGAAAGGRAAPSRAEEAAVPARRPGSPPPLPAGALRGQQRPPAAAAAPLRRAEAAGARRDPPAHGRDRGGLSAPQHRPPPEVPRGRCRTPRSGPGRAGQSSGAEPRAPPGLLPRGRGRRAPPRAVPEPARRGLPGQPLSALWGGGSGYPASPAAPRRLPGGLGPGPGGTPCPPGAGGLGGRPGGWFPGPQPSRPVALRYRAAPPCCSLSSRPLGKSHLKKKKKR